MDFESMNVFGKNNGFKKMELKKFLNVYNVDPTKIDDYIKESWKRYRNVRSRKKDVNHCRTRWFNENKEWIKPILSDFAKRNYGVEII